MQLSLPLVLVIFQPLLKQSPFLKQNPFLKSSALFSLLFMLNAALFAVSFFCHLHHFPITSQTLFTIFKESQHDYKMFINTSWCQSLPINIFSLLQLKFFFMFLALKSLSGLNHLLILTVLLFLLSHLPIFAVPLFLSSKSLLLMLLVLKIIILS